MDQRFYASTYGRFLTSDPYVAGGAAKGSVNNPSDPGSWNRYAYAEADPINKYDPTGQYIDGPCTVWGNLSWACSPFSGMGFNPGTPGPMAYCMVAECPQAPQEGGFTNVYPQCDPSGDVATGANLGFIVDNYSAAAQAGQPFGIPADWILGWAAVESQSDTPAGWIYGTVSQTVDDNYFGQTAGAWNNQTACPLTVPALNGGTTFACFPSFAASAAAALTSFNSRYGNILSAGVSGGQTALQAFTALYVKWGDPKKTAAQQAGLIQSQITNHIDPDIQCLRQNGYLSASSQ